MAESFFLSTTTADWRVLEAMRVGIKVDPMYHLHGRRIGAYSAGEMQLSKVIDPMMLELATYLLTEKLGEERIVEEHVEEHDCLRFASWFDHWKATYRSRWWMRWRRWEVRFNIEHQPVRARVEVDMTKYWTFPEADIIPSEMGRPMGYITNNPKFQRYQAEPPYWTKETREEES
jgi:hypothetical protein